MYARKQYSHVDTNLTFAFEACLLEFQWSICTLQSHVGNWENIIIWGNISKYSKQVHNDGTYKNVLGRIAHAMSSLTKGTEGPNADLSHLSCLCDHHQSRQSIGWLQFPCPFGVHVYDDSRTRTVMALSTVNDLYVDRYLLLFTLVQPGLTASNSCVK